MEEENWQEANLPEELDVEDVKDPSEETDIVYAGNIEEWKLLEFSEKARMRPYITSAVILVWTIGIMISAVNFLKTGNFLLFTPPALITYPLYIVLKFYYGRY